MKSKKNSVREILLMGVFWRILFIEAVLLVYSLFYRWIVEDAGAVELFWYAVRIIVLVTIIIIFMMFALKKFLTHRIITPLESIALANQKIKEDFSTHARLELPEDTPDEIKSIVTSRTDMLKHIIAVSNERLHLVGFIRETFGKYLSEKVVDEILASPKGQQVGGSRKNVTVLMADLRGFTLLSETSDPEEMVQLLNQYLEKMSKIILKYDGIIDEIIGDAILAVFGAPQSHDNDPERAVACAIEMQNSLASVNGNIVAHKYPPLEMGIGVNTGNVIVGNIGSEVRMKYGIVGDAVNRVSRIESNSIGGQVLIGESTFRQVQFLVSVDPPKSVMMKGMKKPLIFYSVNAICTQNINLSLKSPATGGTSLDIRLPFQCWIIRDKKLDVLPILGETLSMDEQIINIVTDQPIDLFTDVKLRFDFCLEAHCFDDIYAKCIVCESKQGKNISGLRITAMEEKDRAIIKRWSAEVLD